MKFTTVATDKKGYLGVLLDCFKRHGQQLVVLGWGKKWNGLITKFKWMLEFLETLPEDEIVVFMDGYDVLYINSKDLEEKFRQYNTNILFGIDTLNFLQAKLYDRCFKPCIMGNKKYRVNSGLYMGYVKYIKIFLGQICRGSVCENTKMNDQKLVSNLCGTDFFRKNIKLDVEKKIFLNLLPKNFLITRESDFQLTDGRVIVNGYEPNFVHGPSNTDLGFIIKSYGYDFDDRDFRTKYILNGIKTYYQYFIPDIIIIVVIIILCIFLLYLKNNRKV